MNIEYMKLEADGICVSAADSFVFMLINNQKERNDMDKSEALRLMTEEKEKIMLGDQQRAAAQKAAGKLTARERVKALFDEQSFVELDALRKCGVITGFGTVNDRPAYCFAQDVTDSGAAMSKNQAAKVIRMLEQAKMTLSPVVIMPDSNGIRLDEGAAALNGYADIMNALTQISGVCPVICCVAGNCPGTAALFSQLSDITVQAGKGLISFNGLKVMQKGADKDKDASQLFGAETMAAQGGVSLTAATEEEAFALVRKLVDLLPSCNQEDAPFDSEDDINRTIASADELSIEKLADEIFDRDQKLELGAAYGKQSHTCLGRIGGRSCGLIAQEGGDMEVSDMTKIARFVRLCDSYRLPVITLVNTTGVAVPASEGQAEVIRASARLLYAYAEASTVKLSVLVGAAVGKAYTLLGGGKMADVIYAWPGAGIAAVSAEVYQRTIGKDDYDTRFSALAAAKEGLVDDVIDPADTRKLLINAMEFMIVKQGNTPDRKHGNMPL